MTKRTRTRLSRIASLLPLNVWRLGLYRFLGYRISQGVFIARGVTLSCEACTLGDNVAIASGNTIVVKDLEIGCGTSILGGNQLVAWSHYSEGHPRANSIRIGEAC